MKTRMTKPKITAYLKEQCGWKTVPIIFEVLGSEEAFVGGYTDLEDYLNGSSKEKEGCGEETDNIVEG